MYPRLKCARHETGLQMFVHLGYGLPSNSANVLKLQEVYENEEIEVSPLG